MYCLNPTCTSPYNSDDQQVCQNCGSRLRLGDRYRPLKPIGQGGFGRTFLAIDEADPLKLRCVIKQFLPQQLGEETVEKAVDLFHQEALRLQELGQHPQIPELLAYLEQDDRQYLVQEFIDGQSLAQELTEAGAFQDDQIRQLLADLLPVLQFIHDRQVIHRDIKPENIIRRTSDGKLFLVDLGAAKYATGTALAKIGTIIGSAEYAAPEQTRGKAVFASDLYSLGATCIHLLTEMSPFDLFDGTDDRWIWQHYLNCSVSHSLVYVLNRMLQSATNRRYQSVDQVLQDLNPTTLQSLSPAERPILVSVFQPETKSWTWVEASTDYSNEPAVLPISPIPEAPPAPIQPRRVGLSERIDLLKEWGLLTTEENSEGIPDTFDEEKLFRPRKASRLNSRGIALWGFRGM